jgi:putative SOS response-associated peptidase YedK
MDPVTGIGHDTATVITTGPNELVADLPHHRMPAVLPATDWAAWLDPATPVPDLQALLRPCPSDWLEVRAGGPQGFS